MHDPVVYFGETVVRLDYFLHGLAVLLEEIKVRRDLKALRLDHSQPLRFVHFQELICRVDIKPRHFVLVVHVDRAYDAVEILQILVYEAKRLLVLEDLPINFHDFKRNRQPFLRARSATLSV